MDKKYISQRKPSEHAGGKWTWRYKSDLQGNPHVEIDLNFLTRVPLWDVIQKSSVTLGTYQAQTFPVLDKHELSGGKLKALFSRHSSRDLFDTYHILHDQSLDIEKLRIAFIVYGSMSRIDWRHIKISDIQYEWVEFKNMLLPMLRKKERMSQETSKSWADKILSGTREKLSQLLPFREKEMEFLNRLLDFGEINPELLSQNEELKLRIAQQPGLRWKAKHVKKHKGIG